MTRRILTQSTRPRSNLRVIKPLAESVDRSMDRLTDPLYSQPLPLLLRNQPLNRRRVWVEGTVTALVFVLFVAVLALVMR